MKFVCTSCGSVYRIENTGGIEPPKSEGHFDPCPCPPPHKIDPDWQAAFCEADNARCKVESELEREREISCRFQAENQELERKVRKLEEKLENSGICELAAGNANLRSYVKEWEGRAIKAENDIKLLSSNYDRIAKVHSQTLENHRMQLAAISTAALRNTETTINERLCPSNPYWTQAYKDVCTAVDREMRERRRANELEEINRRIRRYLGGFGECEQENIKHPTPRK